MELDNVLKQIKELEKERQVFVNIKKEQDKLIDDIDKKIKILTKKYPSCCSCGKRYHPKQMIIATEEDVSDHTDRNEGYSGPEVGEYYCGWC